ncbi:histidine kinase [Hyphococcus flavus]|uniref:Histidine kinase n=1 Tax=Hyphococcus flavus TaxID=1866326 RepID=A0AAE9ZAV4_9PROT|nr:histidine kinase [Hyphococcus flavus]WDI30481.1 histidine kinase [Hyphococcus flavus]
MKFTFILMLLLSFFQLGGTAHAYDAKWREGDAASWAAPGLDETGWKSFDSFAGAPQGVFWIRDRLETSPELLDGSNYILSCEGTGAFEIYFDGLLLGYSGRPAPLARNETPGGLRFSVSLPPALLSPGEHTIALRSSATKLTNPTEFRIECDVATQSQQNNNVSLSLLLLGFAGAASAILFLYFIHIAPTGRPRSSALAALSAALSTTVLAAVETGYQTGFTNYTQTGAINLIALVAALSLYAALPATILLRLNLAAKFWWLAGAGALLFLSLIPWPVGDFDHDTRAFLLLCAYGVVMCLSTQGATRAHARLFAGVLVVCTVGIIIDPDDLYVFLVMLTLFLSVSFIEYLRSQAIRAKQAEVTAARLEADLIRRNIQPHFLMNSLTVVSEWVETDTKSALKFIKGLADEFRLLASYSGKKLIPLDDEITLCRTHLALMGMRQRREFLLSVNGVSGTEQVPPGLFHTIVENAFSHNRFSDLVVTFSLSKSEADRGVTYLFKAPLGRQPGSSATSTGSGLRYVRSRLEESFPQKWELNSIQQGSDWVTIIRILS